MREIKFRAWDGKKMYYWDSTDHTAVNQIVGTPAPKLFYLPMSWLVGDSNDWVWMQYTGLKDKNGKEIYEGDILGYPNPKVKDVVKFGYYDNEQSYEDHYEGCGFYLEGTGYYRIHPLQKGNGEIIGNIYENPELLSTL